MSRYATTEELFECSECETHSAKRELVGKNLSCPKCGQSFMIVTLGAIDPAHQVHIHLQYQQDIDCIVRVRND